MSVLTMIDETRAKARDGTRSLTTPPCSEGVEWLVGVKPVELSREQIETFRAIFHENNRPVQRLEGRSVALVTDDE